LEEAPETKNGGKAMGNENGGEAIVISDAGNENGGDEDGVEDEGIGRDLGEPEEVPYWYYPNFRYWLYYPNDIWALDALGQALKP